ncbi:hypothetical protein KFE25_006765 [Diacronema lutheri]|uniref:AMMECR1 domain-containing protein n=2 Tax=Diacronema lutheri TaxID=2081491 RepID=A0A8J5XMH4_DIALT|nr:hypothetical protein KFE25_006765 [Diacronema lutheri]
MVGGGRGATVEHCVHAFDALHSHFRRAECPPPAFATDEEYPLFVTWNKRDGDGHAQLRGCIGSLRAQPVLAIKDYALSSALQDRRFPPIDEAEVPLLECTVSLLTDFEVARAWDDWELGRHGVWIDFVDPQGSARNATYLPDVPPEQGWSKHETIDSLVRKAGYHGAITNRLRGAIRLTRYQSTLSKLSYVEYTQICARSGAATR